MTDRRTFILGTLATGMLAACVQEAAPGPGAVTVVAQGSSGMNPGPDGSDRPLTLQVLQLRGTGAFDGADFFALQSPESALGADLVKSDQIALAPGGRVQRTIALEPGTVAIGVVAGYRDPSGKVFRTRSVISPTAQATFQLDVGRAGISLRPA